MITAFEEHWAHLISCGRPSLFSDQDKRLAKDFFYLGQRSQLARQLNQVQSDMTRMEAEEGA